MRNVFSNQELEKRKEASRKIREEAAQLADRRNEPEVEHCANADEKPPYAMSFTKGLPHDEETGLVKNPKDFEDFIKAIMSGDPEDYELLHLGPGKTAEGHLDWKSQRARLNKTSVRAWESGSAGLAYDLQGPDSHAVTMPPAPELGTDELTAEMGEVYAQALLRDVPFDVFYDKALSFEKDIHRARIVVEALNELEYFKCGYRNHEPLSLQNAFRGFTKGDQIGPYLSQFLLSGNRGINTNADATKEFDASEGMINYGSLTINQRVRQAQAGINYMTSWNEWLDVQNGANFQGEEAYKGNARRFITTGRDLATYVHYDALYEAYLNACLLMLSSGAKFDQGVPFTDPDLQDKQQGFALYGGPHILTLVTEVATRALKAVRLQKFNVHRRLRPEALAARLERIEKVKPELANEKDRRNLERMNDELERSNLFKMLASENGHNKLLPMAFAEGSPMHPTYGAGHATVAGACVTILKAFFDHTQYLNITEDGTDFRVSDEKGDYAFVPNASGHQLRTVRTQALTVEGELNKLAANISVGRDWAGVHYYSDYKESMLLGEKIAIGMLQEQSISYNNKEGFSLTLPTFENGVFKIMDGKLFEMGESKGKEKFPVNGKS